MTSLTELRPTSKLHVIDLVREAGVDISDWANGKGGEQKARTNPKYCYEWAFVEGGKVVVLNLWHHDVHDDEGVISQTLNPRRHALRLNIDSKRGFLAQRALRMDAAIQTALNERLPVRVVLCAGNASENDHAEGKPLRVDLRALDPIPWAITKYEWDSGQCTVTRGVAPVRFVDQFSEPEGVDQPPLRRKSTGYSFVRMKEVRQTALSRAGGRCECCGHPGFRTPGGSVYLETHHVVPLSEGGLDHPKNVVALCPNHHREAHHGELRDQMRSDLLRMVSGKP